MAKQHLFIGFLGLSVLLCSICTADTFTLTGDHGSSGSNVDLFGATINGSAIKTQLKLQDEIVIVSGTNFFSGSYLSYDAAATPNLKSTSLNDRYTVSVTGGATYFDRIYSSSYGWSNAPSVTLNISGQDTQVTADRIYNWNVGARMTVKDGASVAITTTNGIYNNMTYGTSINLESGGTLTANHLYILPPSRDPEGAAYINISGKSTLKIASQLQFQTGHTPNNKDSYTVMNVYGGGNTVTLGSLTNVVNEWTDTSAAKNSELNFYLDSSGVTCIKTTNANLAGLKTTAQLQYASALTDATSYNILTATGTFTPPGASYLKYSGNDPGVLWETRQNTNGKNLLTQLNGAFSDGAVNFDCAKTITGAMAGKGYINIGAAKTGVTYDLTATFAGDAASWGDFADYFTLGMKDSYTSVSRDNAAQSITFSGLASSEHYLSWDLAAFTASEFTMTKVTTTSSGYAYNLDPVAEGKTGYGTTTAPASLVGLCADISPSDTINLSSGDNYFSALVSSDGAISGVNEDARLKVNITGGTSRFESLNSTIPVWWGPCSDIDISGSETNVIAASIYNLNQGSTITVRDRANLTITAAGLSDTDVARFVYGSSVTVDNASLTYRSITISGNSKVVPGDVFELNISHGSTVIGTELALTADTTGKITSAMNILGDNNITLTGLSMAGGTTMNFIADNTGFATIQVNGSVDTIAGMVSAQLEGGMALLNGNYWKVVQ